MLTLPNFIGIGVPKAGTTSIHYALSGHPDVLLVPQKEAHFFNAHYDKGLQWYSDIFSGRVNNHKIIGDITPAYFVYPEAIERIAADLGPDVKVVVCFRQPLARTYSHYLHNVRIIEHNEPFLDATTGLPDPQFSSPSLYSTNFELMKRLFRPENILALIFERDISGGNFPQRGYPMICEFLGIEPQPIEDIRKGGAYLPKVQFITEPTVIDDRGNALQAVPGDIVVSSVMGSSTGVVSKIEHDPSAERRAWLEGLSRNITCSIPDDVARSLTQRIFADDIARMRELLDDPLPEWDNPKIGLEES